MYKLKIIFLFFFASFKWNNNIISFLKEIIIMLMFFLHIWNIFIIISNAFAFQNKIAFPHKKKIKNKDVSIFS